MLVSMKIKKSKPAKKLRNTLLCWITASSLLALSGCGPAKELERKTEVESTMTAIILDDNNAMLVDIWAIDDDNTNTEVSYGDYALYTKTGDILIVSGEFVEIIEGENARKKAEIIAQILIGEEGNIVSYEEELNKKGLK